jgi:hypothetical protein
MRRLQSPPVEQNTSDRCPLAERGNVAKHFVTFFFSHPTVFRKFRSPDIEYFDFPKQNYYSTLNRRVFSYKTVSILKMDNLLINLQETGVKQIQRP